MKKLIMSLVILAAGPSSFAQTSALQCSTSGSGIALLQVNLRPNGQSDLTIQTSEVETAPVIRYLLISGGKDLSVQNGDSATLVAQIAGANSDAGVRSDAVLLRVLAGRKSAKLALDGSVYELICF